MTETLILAVGMVVMGGIIFFAMRGRNPNSASNDELKGQIEQLTTLTTNLQNTLNTTLREQGEATQKKLGDLQTRLAIIDKAQESLTGLSEQTTRLENVLSNKQARGAYGEMQLENLVSQMLPQNAYQFQPTLSNGSRPDCLINLPNPPGSIVIDSKFPLEAWHALMESETDEAKTAARNRLAADLIQHIKSIAEKYIIPGETAEGAVLFLPSEAVYAELQSHLPKALNESFERRVYIVSPTTLMATLNTMRAILRNVKMHEQAAVIQAEVAKLLDDIKRLNDRVGNLDRHFENAKKDIDAIKTSTGKISNRSEKIEAIEVKDEDEQASPKEDNLLP